MLIINFLESHFVRVCLYVCLCVVQSPSSWLPSFRDCISISMRTQRLAWTTRGGAYKSLDDFISARRRRGRREKAHKREERVLNFKVINLDRVVFGTVSEASTTKIYMPKYVYMNITIIIMILREDCSSGTSLLSFCLQLHPLSSCGTDNGNVRLYTARRTQWSTLHFSQHQPRHQSTSSCSGSSNFAKPILWGAIVYWSQFAW